MQNEIDIRTYLSKYLIWQTLSFFQLEVSTSKNFEGLSEAQYQTILSLMN